MKGVFRSRLWWWLLLIPLVVGVLRLRFDVEVLNLLPEKEPVVQGLKLYQQNFSNARELIITLEGSEPEDVETSARSVAEFVRTQTNLVRAVTWQPPWLEHPEQGAELIAYLWLNQPPEIFGQLTNRFAPTNLPSLLFSARERLSTSFSPEDIARLSYDPYDITRLPEKVTSGAAGFGEGQELFASREGKFRLMFVEARPDLTSYRDCVKWFKVMKESISTQTNLLQPNVIIHYTGRPAFVSEIGGGMERDMGAPSAGTLAVIAILFYLTHRRWRPLLWLLVLLILILAGALALGGFFYGTLNVVSLGFASILLGLAEDFGIVLYQESRTHPDLSLREIRREAAPGIFWSALTTSGAFLLLNLSGLPGLGQLGSLVAIGIVLAAVVMLYAYLPPLLRGETRTGTHVEAKDPHAQATPRSRFYQPAIWFVTTVILLLGIAVLLRRPPVFDKSPDALKPKNSEAYATLDIIKKHLNPEQEPLWVMAQGRDEREIGRKLRKIEPVLQKAASNHLIRGFTLPNPLWPDPDNQQANKQTAAQLVAEKPVLEQAALTNGFTTNSLVLLDNVLSTWQKADTVQGVFWPSNANSTWILEKLIAKKDNELLAIGFVYPNPVAASEKERQLRTLQAQLPRDGVWLSGWELLGSSVARLVLRDLPKVVVPIALLVLVSLWLAYRSFKEVLLSLATIVFSGLCLVLVMHFAGWSWNMMNLMSVPLLLGMGVDFSIHIQLSLRKHRDLDFVRRSIGSALLLAGSTTVAGFASLAFSSNSGIASLGMVCATGITISMLIAVYLLPVWWKAAGD